MGKGSVRFDTVNDTKGKMKRHIAVICLMVITSLVLWGCGSRSSRKRSAHKDNSKKIEAEKNTEESSVRPDSEEEQTGNQKNEIPHTEWKHAYADFLENNKETEDGSDLIVGPECRLSLIYLDDDNIPEVFDDIEQVEAAGEAVLSYQNGKVIYIRTPRLGTMYIERSGLLYTDTGHMGCYPVFINQLKDGKFQEIGHGERDELYDDNSNFLGNKYTWEDKPVTEKEYNARIDSLFDREKGQFPQNWQTYDEFISSMMSGENADP